MTDEALKDFGRLACQRCEKAINSVAQMLETAEQACELQLNVINAMMVACAELMQASTIKPGGAEPTMPECIEEILTLLARANRIAEIRVSEKNRNERHLS